MHPVLEYLSIQNGYCGSGVVLAAATLLGWFRRTLLHEYPSPIPTSCTLTNENRTAVEILVNQKTWPTRHKVHLENMTPAPEQTCFAQTRLSAVCLTPGVMAEYARQKI